MMVKKGIDQSSTEVVGRGGLLTIRRLANAIKKLYGPGQKSCLKVGARDWGHEASQPVAVEGGSDAQGRTYCLDVHRQYPLIDVESGPRRGYHVDMEEQKQLM